MSPVDPSEQVTEPKVPIAGQEGPHAEDQSDERLPWPRLIRYALLALGLFALAACAALVVLRDELGQFSDDRSIAGRDVHAEQIGIVEPRLIERETRAQELAAARKAQLDEWGWVDREKNLVRMPIERAMQRVVEGRR
jgi:hypothetical protein